MFDLMSVNYSQTVRKNIITVSVVLSRTFWRDSTAPPRVQSQVLGGRQGGRAPRDLTEWIFLVKGWMRATGICLIFYCTDKIPDNWKMEQQLRKMHKILWTYHRELQHSSENNITISTVQ